MTDALTNNYSLVQPQVGADNNTWGGILNNGTIAATDSALGAVQAVSITSSDVSLTTSQFANAIFIVTGALTGDHNIIVPLSPNSGSVACGGRFVVVNNTTGAFTITVITAAGGSVGVTVGQGQTAFLYSDGLNVGYSSNGVGAVFQSSNGNPNGQLAGIAGSVNTNASVALDYTNGNIWVCTTSGTAGSAVWSPPSISVKRGFDTAINLQLNVTVASNLLTVAVKAADTGSDPTAIDPVTVEFGDVTLPNGDPVTVNITSALSISTVSGATLGSTNGVPFRFWIVLFNNGGTPVLGLVNCSGPSGILAPNESSLVSSLAMVSGGAVGSIYTASPLTSKAFRFLGFLTYETALVTAGTYNNPPDVVRLFGPGVLKPGEAVKSAYGSQTGTTTANSTTKVGTTTAASITPTSKVNPIRVLGSGTLNNPGGGVATSGAAQIGRNNSSTLVGTAAFSQASANVASSTSCCLFAFDTPNANTSQTYTVYIWCPLNSPTLVWNPSFTGVSQYALIEATELMG